MWIRPFAFKGTLAPFLASFIPVLIFLIPSNPFLRQTNGRAKAIRLPACRFELHPPMKRIAPIRIAEALEGQSGHLYHQLADHCISTRHPHDLAALQLHPEDFYWGHGD
jgi:hypothetical protein